MPRFWWVNHNQTASQEIGGQYLWSPKVERGGVRSQFYDNMREARLTPDADLLFDRGFISFKDDGEALVSSRVEKADLRRLGFDQLAAERFGFEEAPAVWRIESFAAHQQGYLAYHLAQVFIS